MTRTAEQRVRLGAIALSFAVGTALMAVKFFAWHRTGSSAILSDALESIINVIASGFAFASVHIAERPPDDDHPYGHGKIEYFSAGFEGALIVLAALGVFYTGVRHMIVPRPLPHLPAGLALLTGAAAVNLLLGWLLVRVGRRTRSLTLVADGRHVLTDVITSAGVVLGLILVQVTGRYWLDGLVACLMGIQILVSGTRLVREAISGLMDRIDPGLMDRLADRLNRERRPLWIDIHELRWRQAGRTTHVSLHLLLPRDLSLAAAHEEAERLEALIGDFFEDDARIVIHMDPCRDIDCAACLKDPCEARTAPGTGRPPWTRRGLMAAGTAADAPGPRNGN